MKHKAFVLSMYDTGFATAKALQEAGVPVVGFDPSTKQPGMYTRLFPVELCPPPEQDRELLEFLRIRRVHCEVSPVLYPASDAFVSFCIRNETDLKRDFLFLLPEAQLAADVLTKSRQAVIAAEAGAILPRTFSWQKDRPIPSVSFPVYVKPENTAAWKKVFPDKGKRLETASELAALLQKAGEANLALVLQEIVPGAPTNNFEVSAYIDSVGEVHGPFVMQKLRQFPYELGTGTFGKSVQYTELQRQASKLFQTMKLRGMVNAEFKWNENIKGFQFIEVNLRVWQQILLAAEAGINFPLLQYKDLTGKSLEKQLGYKESVFWIDPLLDGFAFLEGKCRGIYPQEGWLTSLWRAQIFGIFFLKDPWPAMRSQVRTFLSLLRFWFLCQARLLKKALSNRGLKALFVRMLPTRFTRPRTKYLYIFNYHRVRDMDAPPTSFDENGFSINAQQFREQMAWIQKNFQVLAEKELLGLLRGENRLQKEKPLAMVTFDDGYIDNFTVALPILREYKIPAIFFIPTEMVEKRKIGWWDTIAFLVKNCGKREFTFRGQRYPTGKESKRTADLLIGLRKREKNPAGFLEELQLATDTDLPSVAAQSSEIMTWEQLKTAQEFGISIGSHSHSHSILSQMTAADQKKELEESKTILENRLGTKVQALAYPVGTYSHFTEETKKLAKLCGYEAAFSFMTGTAEVSRLDAYDVKRVYAPGDLASFHLGCAFPEWFFRNRTETIRERKSQ